jgi:hypothetical protein
VRITPKMKTRSRAWNFQPKGKAVQIDHDRYKLQPSYLLAGAQPLVPRRIPWFCPRTFSS